MNSQHTRGTILFAHGTGGHSEQMKRVASLIGSEPGMRFVAISEPGGSIGCFEKVIWERHIVPAIRGKYGKLRLGYPIINSLYVVIRILIKSAIIIKKNRIKLVVSTGPGLCIPIGIASRFLGCRVVHIETWSRFSRRSLTGSFMRFIATDLWIQSRELQKLYPKATFVGML